MDLFKYLTKIPVPNPNVAVSLAQGASDDMTDATATAEDIAESKTAYIATGKVIGTLKELNTSDATAIEADIVSGKTAYVNGEKILGTLICPDIDENNTIEGEQVYYFGEGTIFAEGPDLPTYAVEWPVNSSVFLKENSKPYLVLHKENIAGAIGLYPEDIKQGVTICGVTGTYTGE